MCRGWAAAQVCDRENNIRCRYACETREHPTRTPCLRRCQRFVSCLAAQRRGAEAQTLQPRAGIKALASASTAAAAVAVTLSSDPQKIHKVRELLFFHLAACLAQSSPQSYRYTRTLILRLSSSTLRHLWNTKLAKRGGKSPKPLDKRGMEVRA